MNTTAAIAKNVGSIVTLVRDSDGDSWPDTMTFEVMTAGVVKVNDRNYGVATARKMYSDATAFGNYRRAAFGCFTAAERAEINRQESGKEARKAAFAY